MKKVLFLLLISSPAFAQVPAEYHFTVTPEEADLIGAGLQTQPYGKVFPLMNKLHQQVLEQVSPKKPIDPPKSDTPVADPPKEP